MYLMMKETLSTLSDLARKLGGEQALTHAPARDDAVTALEQKLNTALPDDYKTLLAITNGLKAPIDTEPSFLPAERVDYLNNVDAELINIWRETGNEEIADLLATSILVAGRDEEQQFLLLPPHTHSPHWQYWKFAHWIPGEEPYDNLTAYFDSVVVFMQEELDNA